MKEIEGWLNHYLIIDKRRISKKEKDYIEKIIKRLRREEIENGGSASHEKT